MEEKTWRVRTFAGNIKRWKEPFLNDFCYPYGVIVDSSGFVYVADTGNNRIRKITPAGKIITLAGRGGLGTAGFADGTGIEAQFDHPFGVAVDSSGFVYVADTDNHRIRKITPEGAVSTFVGSSQGYKDGAGTAAQFNEPTGVAVDSSGNLYVADTGNNRIRKITPEGEVSTLAGDGTTEDFNYPYGVTVDSFGNVYVADYENHRIQKITPKGEINTLAGNGARGYKDGTGIGSQFDHPSGVAVDSSGFVYVADYENHRIRKISPAGNVGTLAGSGECGYGDGFGTKAHLFKPYGVAVDSDDILYVADSNNHCIRKIGYK